MPIEYALSSLSHSFSRGKQKLRCDVVRFSRPTQLPPPHWSLNFCFVFYLTPLSSPLPPDAAALKSAEGFGDSDAGSETYREREKDRAERRERVTAKAKKSETPCVWKRKEERKEKRGKKREMKRQKKREEIRTWGEKAREVHWNSLFPTLYPRVCSVSSANSSALPTPACLTHYDAPHLSCSAPLSLDPSPLSASTTCFAPLSSQPDGHTPPLT